ncbi:16S rRNA (cytosine(1402)-N(4))-methyltransferase RsmH [Pseudonocardia asaccharolytica]|uniref:Ribosomal RNA small subunit methyltransferase H n=1 Tax=Pseudonocardia asaccharolytica DSM 44247 = NBRC 16224 TaxID=1123024 RepID=A0A511CXB3_9PSEU|nr:16S rRNA (cytosine(1402)-N(4))-methyltransferase RsmH [Pseudonocardia asaccharolytica]GEL17200.1 ribosomal RNA small subunit methyltransferase H [Pseudonocardia asaccharolytica DSM 44247 = NBRC 16224]
MEQRSESGDGPAGARHVPVLLPRVTELLDPALSGRPAVLVDATLGLGGHSAALLAAYPQLTLVGLDRDPQALELAGRRLVAHAGRSHLVHAVYDRIAEVLGELDVRRIDGALFDLGVSSLQLDATERGFSYARDADLDMRMDASTGPTAAEVLNTYPIPELARILREYGEERFASRIAAAVGRRRSQQPFTRSAELVELLYDAVPAASRRTGGHPAKRTFQALRIEVNGELDALRAALPAAIDALAVGGRIVVLSYHSLEDRIVKRELAARSTSRTPAGLPVELPGHGPQLRLLTRGAEVAPEDEITDNPRAASVRLRAAERIREVAA